MSTVPKDKLGTAGSINGLVRNLGMVFGISLSTVILYTMMSVKLGYSTTDFVDGRRMPSTTACILCICLPPAFVWWRVPDRTALVEQQETPLGAISK